MNQAFTDAIKEAYALAPTNQVTLETLEIRQLGVQVSVFMVQSRRSVSALDETGVLRHFEPVGFQFSLPASSQDGFQSLNVAIDNVGRRGIDFVQTALESVVPVQIVYRPYFSTDLSQPQMKPPLVLILKDISITVAQITGQATFMDIINKKFPSQLYTRDRFPALF